MNILIIGGSGDSSSANSVCILNLAKEFLLRGHKVWNLAKGETYIDFSGDLDGMTVWQIPPSYHDRLWKNVKERRSRFLKIWFRIESTLRHIIIYPFYPKASFFREKIVFRKAKKIIESNAITLVIAIFNNYDNIYAGIKLKKLFGNNIKVVSYHLDLRTASRNSCEGIRDIVRRKAVKSVIQESNIVDKILVPFSGQVEIIGMDGVKLDKIKFVGFPVFVDMPRNEKYGFSYEDDCINICYIGSLSLDNRNPSQILSLIEKASKHIDKRIVVHFWGDMGGLESVIHKSPVAVYHGEVDNRYVGYLMDNSDYLLNIGNAIAFSMLPSKVFGCFATGKPIINVINHPEDATIPFFCIYNHSIDLSVFNTKESELVALLIKTIPAMYNAPLRETEGLFEGFKPKVICDLILS